MNLLDKLLILINTIQFLIADTKSYEQVLSYNNVS